MHGKSFVKSITIMMIMMVLASSVYAQHRPRRMKRPAVVQPAPSIGFRIGNDFKHDQYFAGAHFWLPLSNFWYFIPSFDYYFSDNETKRWQFNGDFVFKPRFAGAFYLGGGFMVQYLTLDNKTDVGGNALLGLEFGGRRKPRVYPYIQARWTFLKDQNYFSLLGGVNFALR